MCASLVRQPECKSRREKQRNKGLLPGETSSFGWLCDFAVSSCFLTAVLPCCSSPSPPAYHTPAYSPQKNCGICRQPGHYFSNTHMHTLVLGKMEAGKNLHKEIWRMNECWNVNISHSHFMQRHPHRYRQATTTRHHLLIHLDERVTTVWIVSLSQHKILRKDCRCDVVGMNRTQATLLNGQWINKSPNKGFLYRKYIIFFQMKKNSIFD